MELPRHGPGQSPGSGGKLRRITRPAPGHGRGEGIVQPIMKMMDQLSRRLHQQRPPAERPGGPWPPPQGSRNVPSRRVARLSPEDAAYLAGLIDGEGTIALSRRHAGDNRQLVVTISSTESALVEWVRTALGVGKITRKRTTSPRHAPGLTYCVTNRQALDVLAQVSPFLRSYKRDRADLVLRRYLAVTPRNGKYTEAMRSARQRFEAEFASLSIRRG